MGLGSSSRHFPAKGGSVSLSDELQAEATLPPSDLKRSQIDVFLETLSEEDQADVHAWIQARKSPGVLYRVLKRRGLTVADSTFRNWCVKCR